MKVLSSIKTKISIFLILFSIVLISSLLGYMYWYGRQNILNQSEKALRVYSALLQDDFETQINNSVYELSGLIFQLDRLNTQIPHGTEQVINDLFPLENFLTGYVPKYKELLLFHPDWENYIELSPVIVFGGEYKTQKLTKTKNNLSAWLMRHLSEQPKETLVLGPEYQSGAEAVHVLIPFGKDKKSILISTIPFSYFSDKILDMLNLPDSYQVSIADKQGIIIHATEEVQKLKKVQDIVSVPKPTSGKNLQESLFHSGKKLVLRKALENPQITIIFERDLAPEMSEFNLTLLRMLVFALLLLALVILLVRVLTGKLTQIFQEITETTDRLAVGDFSEKINIQRDDELGLLISSFNSMVDELRKSYLELENVNSELRKKIKELHQTKTELSQKEHLALIGETISKISHEIQNKISGVSVWVQNLEFYAEQDATLQEYVNEIKTALISFMEMLTNFKRFYREPELNPTEFEIRPFIDFVVNQFSGQAQSNQVHIKIECAEECGEIRADREHMELVLSNIILNAIYYAPKSSEIVFRCYVEKNRIVFMVKDQGPGIPAEISGKIFQPFFTTKTSGSGLGLAMAHAIIGAHLGEISFENNPDKGACFKIKLPIRPDNLNS